MKAMWSRSEVVAFYERYITRCNEHRFEELDEFVAPDVVVGGATTIRGIQAYGAGLRNITTAFPDFHWEPQSLVVDGQWLSVRLTNTGTHAATFQGIEATGRSITVQELAMYRLEDGKIAQCWGDLGAAVRDQLTPTT